MSESATVDGFVPSRNGLHFVNGGFPPPSNYPVLSLPLVGTVIAQDANKGVCGGFVFVALDLFVHEPMLLPTTETEPPPGNTPMFKYLTTRFVDSFGAGPPFANAAKAISWIQTPSHNVLIPHASWSPSHATRATSAKS